MGPAPEPYARARKTLRFQQVPEESGAGRMEIDMETLSATASESFSTTASETIKEFPLGGLRASSKCLMSRIGSFALIQFAISFAVIALPLGSSVVTAQTPSSSASFETLAANAVSGREAGRIDEAIRNYRAAVELRPAWDEGWWYLGTLLYDTDHFEEAIPALRRVVELAPKAGPAWAFLGLCEFEAGDYPKALVDLQSAREIGFSENPDIEKVVLYHLGLLLNLHGQFERATELLVSCSICMASLNVRPSFWSVRSDQAISPSRSRWPLDWHCYGLQFCRRRLILRKMRSSMRRARLQSCSRTTR